jgi:hypothetical protein
MDGVPTNDGSTCTRQDVTDVNRHVPEKQFPDGVRKE